MMHRLLVFLFVLAPFAGKAFAGDPVSSLGSKTRWLKPIPQSKWVGKSVYFLAQWRGVRGDYAPGMPRDSFVGRTAIIKSIENSGNTLVLQMTDDDTIVRMGKVNGVFRDLLILDEFDRASKFLMGKTFYPIAQQSMLYDWDSVRESGRGTRIPRFTPFKVIAIERGYDSDNQLRVTLTDSDSNTGYWFGSLSNTNRDPKHEYDFLMFERCFSQKDPRALRKWPDSMWTAIAEGKLIKSMTPEQVKLSRANPISIEKKQLPNCDESWVYFDLTTLCFYKGRLQNWESVSIQSAPSGF